MPAYTTAQNLCFEQKYEKYQIFLSENFPFLVVKFSVYLIRRVFVMQNAGRQTPLFPVLLQLFKTDTEVSVETEINDR